MKDYTISTKIKVEIEGLDNNRFNVLKDTHEMLFVGGDRTIDALSLANQVMKGINSLARKSVVTVWLYKGEDYKTIKAYRWTYEGYNGNEWMERELHDGYFEVTDKFVLNKDIKKAIIRLVGDMNAITLADSL